MANTNPTCDGCSKRHDPDKACQLKDLAKDFIPTPMYPPREIYLPLILPGLNEVTTANRSHWSKGAKLKREVEDAIMDELRPQRVIPIGRCHIDILFVEKNKRRDKDNVMSAQKFILDALQKYGILKKDNNQFVASLVPRVAYAKEIDQAPGVYITLKEDVDG